MKDQGHEVGKSIGEAPALELEHLGFTYPQVRGSRARVLSDATLRVPSGTFCLLVGSTGSGKTTLLRLCKPELAPVGTKTGTIRFFGSELASLPANVSSGQIGYVFQDPEAQIVCDTVWHEMAFGMENLGVPQAEMRRRVAETCYFFGMEPWLHAKTAELSGGQRQLLALASVLTMRPRLLLLDEPTSMLDPVSEGNFLSMLYRINRELGVTVVVATHRPAAMVEYATAAYELDAGVLRPVELASLASEPPLLSKEQGSGPDCAGDSPRKQGRGPCFSRDGSRMQGSNPQLSRAESPEPCVRCFEVWFRYGRDDEWVFRKADFSLREGEVRAVVGGNGSGKSTLLGLIAGVLKPQHGRVTNELRASQALLPQSPKALLSQQSVHEELMEWAPAGGYDLKEALALLASLGFAGVAREPGEKDAQTLLARHPYDLSGGEQQLLALAKLLLVHPRILLLDEPTKGLDHAARAHMAKALLQARAGGATILMATHDLALARQVADSVSLLFDGEVTLAQPCGDFFRNSWVWRA